MWGGNVFEGVRAYWLEADRQLSIFRLRDHLARLRRSAKCMRLRVDHSDDELEQACVELLRANELAEDVHLVQCDRHRIDWDRRAERRSDASVPEAGRDPDGRAAGRDRLTTAFLITASS